MSDRQASSRSTARAGVDFASQDEGLGADLWACSMSTRRAAGRNPLDAGPYPGQAREAAASPHRRAWMKAGAGTSG